MDTFFVYNERESSPHTKCYEWGVQVYDTESEGRVYVKKIKALNNNWKKANIIQMMHAHEFIIRSIRTQVEAVCIYCTKPLGWVR